MSSPCFSALQRAEIAEIAKHARVCQILRERFSALQRAEIAEMHACGFADRQRVGFSALQRAEIAEISRGVQTVFYRTPFQCSSTSRNC